MPLLSACLNQISIIKITFRQTCFATTFTLGLLVLGTYLFMKLYTVTFVVYLLVLLGKVGSFHKCFVSFCGRVVGEHDFQQLD